MEIISLGIPPRRIDSKTGLLILALIACVMSSYAWGFVTHQKIQNSGELHVGVHQSDHDKLLDSHYENLAKRLGATPVIHQYVGYDQLFSALKQGEIDLIGDPMSLQRPLKSEFEFTLPLRHADLWLVSGTNNVEQQEIAVRFDSDSWHHALNLRRKGQSVAVKVLPAQTSHSALLNQLAKGQLTTTLAYHNQFQGQHQERIKPLKMIHSDLALAWVLRSGDPVLKSHVDDYLQEIALTSGLQFKDFSDWDKIKQRGSLRLITLYRPETYFAWKGQLLGFDFELAKRFADVNQLKLEVLIASDKRDLMERLAAGEADFGAAFLTEADIGQGLQASQAYFSSGSQLVSQKGRFHRLQTVDLHHKRIVSIQTDPARQILMKWKDAGIGLHLTQVDSSTDPAQLIDHVTQGDSDFALVPTYRAQLESLWRDDLQLWPEMETQEDRVWVVRKDNPLLLNQINQYWSADKVRKSLAYRLLAKKYFNPGQKYAQFQEALKAFALDSALSPYDELIQRYAGYYDFDWRLILAVTFAESRFDPNAVSSAGAKGLMQVKDVAARQVDIYDMFDPQSGIHAGVKYLDWVRDQFEVGLTVQDRTWFSLAAYNAGIGRVIDARKLAPKLGLDARRWNGHVEKALLALPDHDPDGRYRSFKPKSVVSYVNIIRQQFETYVRLTANDPEIHLERRIAARKPEASRAFSAPGADLR